MHLPSNLTALALVHSTRPRSGCSYLPTYLPTQCAGKLGLIDMRVRIARPACLSPCQPQRNTSFIRQPVVSLRHGQRLYRLEDYPHSHAFHTYFVL